MNVVLIGFMGTGKSTLGRLLARQLRARWVDTDRAVERRIGKPVPQIFAEQGEAAFRAQETRLLQKLVSAPGPLVLSTGGGTPLRPENADLLRRIGTVIWLQVSAETILARVGRNLESRPLLAGFADDPHARICALLEERAPAYAAAADWGIELPWHAPPGVAVAQIIARLQSGSN